MRMKEARSIDQSPAATGGKGVVILAAGVMLAAAAFAVRQKTRQAERTRLPEGKYIEVDGVRLHYIESGRGQPLVLLHGIGCMAQDFEICGLIGLASNRYRVIAFDRPGYGYSEHPCGSKWAPREQAEILHRALLKLGCERPVVAGHSWGAQVAIALALQHPGYVRGLALLSGYYFPTCRPDFLLSAVHAIPVIGEILRHTVSPLLARMMRPAVLKIIFGPAPVPPHFAAFPLWLALRPAQLQASIKDNLSMIPSVMAVRWRYRELTMPVIIVAGDGDRLVSTPHHSVRLHRQLPNSELRLIPGAGHMIHHTAPRQVMAAIDSAARGAA